MYAYESILNTLGPISHWIYASQYLKTSFLTEGIAKRAILLVRKNKTVLDKCNQISQWDEFVRKHNQID